MQHLERRVFSRLAEDDQFLEVSKQQWVHPELKFLEKFGELALKPISFVGHGIGLFLHEEPYLGANSDTILESGMVLGIEPLAYVEGRFGLQCKDMIVITEDGCQLFSDVTNTNNIFLVS